MANQAAFEGGYQQGIERGSESRLRKQDLKDQELQTKITDLIAQRTQNLTNLSQLKPGTPDYDQSFNALRQTDTALKQLFHPDTNPGALVKFGHLLTDHLKITSPEKRAKAKDEKIAKGLNADEREASAQAASVPLSPEKQAEIKSEAASVQMRKEYQTANDLWDKEHPDATKEERLKAHYENFQRLVLGVTGNQPRSAIKPDIQTFTLSSGKKVGVQYDPDKGWTYLNGEAIPPELLKDATIDPKAAAPIKGPIIRTKPGQSSTGWAQLYLDKFDPNRVVAWQPVTVSRYYMGSESSDISIDAFGVITRSQRTTQPIGQQQVDIANILSAQLPLGTEEMPETPQPAPAGTEKVPAPATAPQGGVPSKSATKQGPKSPPPLPAPPASPTAPASDIPSGSHRFFPNPLGSQFLPLDEDMHIPSWTKDNPYVREKANELLDGVDIKELGIPGKDSAAAENLARKYGWGRGAYTPRELKQIQNADQFLDSVLESKAFMKALDSGFFQKLKMAEAESDPSKESLFGRAGHLLAVQNLSPEQQEAVRLRQSMMGTVSGLSSVVRTGRPTEATIHRLALEIPDVMASASSKDAKERIANIKKEIAVALKQGVPKPSLTGELGKKGQSSATKPATSPDAIKSLREKLINAQTQ